jgi:hypothetical protein
MHFDASAWNATQYLRMPLSGEYSPKLPDPNTYRGKFSTAFPKVITNFALFAFIKIISSLFVIVTVIIKWRESAWDNRQKWTG